MDGADLHDVDWEDLRHFAAFVEAKTLSGAARRLRVDHVTVARRLAALERALGVKLVDRRTRVPTLTREGLRIAERAARMELESHAVVRAARGLSPRVGGEVSVSAPPTLANACIAPRLAELRRANPEIHLRLLGEKRVASLSRREADVALRLVRPTESGLVGRRIGAFRFHLYAAPAYLRARRTADLEFIAFDPDSSQLPQDRWLQRVIGERDVVLRTNDLETQRTAARAGVGAAALPDFLAEGDAGLSRVRVRAKPVEREIWLVVHDDLRTAPAVRAVMDFLATVVPR